MPAWDDFFSDVQIDPELLIHRADVYNPVDGDGGAGDRKVGTTDPKAKPSLLAQNVSCLIEELDSDDAGDWKAISQRATHKVYLPSTLAVKTNAIVVARLNGRVRKLVITGTVDALGQGIVWTYTATERKVDLS